MYKWAIGLGLALAASGAQAALYTVTYAGTAGGYDPSGYFGLGTYITPGTAGFSLQFTIDSERPGAVLSNFPAAQRYSGDTAATNPFVASRFTLNGISRDWGTAPAPYQSFGTAYRGDGSFGMDDVSFESHEFTASGLARDEAAIYLYSSVNQIVQDTGIFTPLDYLVRPGDEGEGYFRSYSADWSRYVDLNLRPTRITIAAVAAPVPEPATWAMMIFGLGAAGWRLRREARNGGPALA